MRSVRQGRVGRKGGCGSQGDLLPPPQPGVHEGIKIGEPHRPVDVIHPDRECGGHIDQSLRVRLGVAFPAGVGKIGSIESGRRETIGEIGEVQQMRRRFRPMTVQSKLAERGYYPGGIDGLWGAGTLTATDAAVALQCPCVPGDRELLQALRGVHTGLRQGGVERGTRIRQAILCSGARRFACRGG